MESSGRGIGEGRRKAAHAALLLAVPFFRLLSVELLVALSGAAFLAAWALGPVLFSRLARPGEGWPRFSLAVASFPLASGLLLLLFPERPGVAAGALALLAAGDAAASGIGGRIGSPDLPWNRRKTIAGSAAFLLAGLPAAAVSYAAVEGAPLGEAFLLLLAPVLLGAAIESLPSRLGDNLPVALFPGVLLGSLAEAETIPWGEAAARVPAGLLVVSLLAFTGLRSGSLDRSGAAAGIFLGGAVYAAAGPGGFLPLVLFVLLGSAASRIGPRRHAPRGARHAIANLGIPFFFALLAWLGGGAWVRAAFAGSLAAALADTLSGEIGMLSPVPPRLILGFRPVRAGTNGGVTLLGTFAGAAGSLLAAVACAATGWLGPALIGPVALAGFAGTITDSLLGASAERSGLIGNEEVNFLSILAAALLAGLAGAS
ncbi:MAG: DUF92 domain-containing protein [Candidatus Eisenbacteria bacterium]